MPKHHDTRDDTPLTARTVAAYLGIALSTLNMWLAADEERLPSKRRFHFHAYRGRKRVWSAQAFRLLQRAIETESEPGGRLGGWRDGSGGDSSGSGGASTRAKDDTAAAEAMRKVLGYSHDDVTSRERDALVRINCEDTSVMPPEDPCAPR